MMRTPHATPLPGRSARAAAPAIALTTLFACAAQAAAPPSGGQLLQEVPPQAARPAQAPPTIVIVRPDSSPTAPGEDFLVQHIEVTGSALLPMTQLRNAIAPREGRRLTLADLQRLCDDITEMYRRAGYPYARAYVPAQTLKDDTVHIAVVEARYDSVKLRNRAHVRDSVAAVPLADLKIGAAVDQAALDRTLLLVSDIPGVVVKGTLRPGRTSGASELLVDVDPTRLLNGSVSLDDYGNAATGRPRFSANASLAEPLELGDVLSASVLTSGRGLDYGRLGYSIPVYGPATQFNVAASSLSYRVIYGDAVDVDARGTAQVAQGGLKQFLYRSTPFNVYGQLTFAETLLRDHIGAVQTRTDRHTDDWRAAVTGSEADTFGYTNASISITVGHLGFDDLASSQGDAAGARTRGNFTKYNLDLSRVQDLGAKTSLYASFDYQAANANLDPSEQFFVGGPNSVRAYDNGVASGTQGNSFTLELRQRFLDELPGSWQGGVFVDTAHLRIAKDVYDTGANSAQLAGAGVSLDWTHAGGWAVDSSLARAVGGTPADVGHQGSVRVWVQLLKVF